MNDNKFADWLEGLIMREPMTGGEIFEHIARLRREGEKLDDLPKTPAECDAALKRLSVAGRAVAVVWEGKQAWRWEVAPEKVVAQGELF